MPMSATPSLTQSDFSAGSLPVTLLVEAPAVCTADLKNDGSTSRRASLGKRTLLAFARLVITVCISVAATLAWLSYGDAAKQIIANSSLQLGWLAPQAASVAQNTPDMIAPAVPPTPSPDQQRLNAMSLDLDAVRQSVDRIGSNQEQLMRSVDQFAATQERMIREITKLQAVEQYVLYKNSEPPPRSAPPPVPKPVPRPSPAPTMR
jgi:hypothetical protein